MLLMAFHTFRERWTLFAGALLSVALGVGMVQSCVAILVAAGDPHSLHAAAPAARHELQQQLDDVSTLMGMTLMLGLFLTIFIVGSTFAFTVSERRRDLGLLRLSGASRTQVRLLLLGEGALLGVFGSALGVIFGIGLLRVQLFLLGRLEPGLGTLPIGAEWWMPLADLSVGVTVAVAGVLLAAHRAARVRPLEALGNTGDAARVMTPVRWVIGVLSLAVSVALVAGAQASHDIVVAIAAGLGLIFAGSIALHQLSPLVVPLFGRVLAIALRRNVIGDLAQASLREGVRRTASTAGPLIVLVGLVVGMFGILDTQAAATATERTQLYDAQLVVTTPAGHDTDRIARTAGVAAAVRMSPLPTASASLDSRHGQVPLDPQDAAVMAVDPTGYAKVLKNPTTAGNLAQFRDGTAVFGPDTMSLVSKRQRSVRVTFAGHGAVRLPAVAHLHETLGVGQGVLIPRASVPRAVLAAAPTTTLVQTTDPAMADTVAGRLRSLGVGEVSTLAAWSQAQAADDNRQNVSVMGALAGVGGSYALLSVINAVAIGAAQRKREFAVGRISGLHRSEILRAAVTESVAVAVIGLLLGSAVAAACLAGIRRGTQALLGQPVLAIPWTVFGLIAAVSLGAVVITTLAATWAATRQPPVGLVAARE